MSLVRILLWTILSNTLVSHCISASHEYKEAMLKEETEAMHMKQATPVSIHERENSSDTC